jgi:CDP-paratose 2-epimerase
MLEAIELIQEITGRELNHSYSETNRTGDHIWYISNLTKFKNDYPNWNWQYSLKAILEEMNENMKNRF